MACSCLGPSLVANHFFGPCIVLRYTIVLVRFLLRYIFVTRYAVDDEVAQEFYQLEYHDDSNPQIETECAPDAGSKSVSL